MSVLKEKAQVVMIPFEGEGIIAIDKTTDQMTLVFDNCEHEDFTRYHLYVTSDEQVREGDLVLVNGYKVMMCGKESYNKPSVFNEKSFAGTLINEAKVIISSTNGFFGLPKLPEKFIRQYVDKYNKGSITSDILVEYKVPDCSDDLEGADWEEYYELYLEKVDTKFRECDVIDWSFDEGNRYLKKYAKLKVSEDSTITILPIKNSWSREEVIELIKKYEEDNLYYGRDSYYRNIDIPSECIKENL